MYSQQYPNLEPGSQPPPQYEYNNNNNNNASYAYEQNGGGAYEPMVPKSAARPREDQFNYSSSTFRDKPFYFLFIVHLCGVIAITVLYGEETWAWMKKQADVPPASGEVIDPFQLSKCLIAACVMASLFAFVWLHVIKAYAGAIIKISMVCTVIMMLAGAGFAFYAGSIVGGVISLFFCAINVCYYFAVQRRIPFTQAILKASSQSLQDHCGPLVVSVLTSVISIAWTIYWTFTVFCVYYSFGELDKPTDDQVVLNGFAYFGLLVSFYWTVQVLKNISHVTTAGTVGSWWLVPEDSAPTCSSFKRACTTSFGSIALGSLIVAFIQAIRVVIQMARDSARKSRSDGAACLLGCLECIVGCIDNIVQYFNFYAYTQVAIYGKDFITAGKDTWVMFKAKGFEVLINDDLTGMVLGMGCLMGGILAGCTGGLLASLFKYNDELWALTFFTSCIVGFFITALVMAVISSAVATTYVLWAELPRELAQNRPTYFNEMLTAAHRLHPQRRFD